MRIFVYSAFLIGVLARPPLSNDNRILSSYETAPKELANSQNGGYSESNPAVGDEANLPFPSNNDAVIPLSRERRSPQPHYDKQHKSQHRRDKPPADNPVEIPAVETKPVVRAVPSQNTFYVNNAPKKEDDELVEKPKELEVAQTGAESVSYVQNMVTNDLNKLSAKDRNLAANCVRQADKIDVSGCQTPTQNAAGAVKIQTLADICGQWKNVLSTLGDMSGGDGKVSQRKADNCDNSTKSNLDMVKVVDGGVTKNATFKDAPPGAVKLNATNQATKPGNLFMDSVVTINESQTVGGVNKTGGPKSGTQQNGANKTSGDVATMCWPVSTTPSNNSATKPAGQSPTTPRPTQNNGTTTTKVPGQNTTKTVAQNTTQSGKNVTAPPKASTSKPVDTSTRSPNATNNMSETNTSLHVSINKPCCQMPTKAGNDSCVPPSQIIIINRPVITMMQSPATDNATKVTLTGAAQKQNDTNGGAVKPRQSPGQVEYTAFDSEAEAFNNQLAEWLKTVDNGQQLQKQTDHSCKVRAADLVASLAAHPRAKRDLGSSPPLARRPRSGWRLRRKQRRAHKRRCEACTAATPTAASVCCDLDDATECDACAAKTCTTEEDRFFDFLTTDETPCSTTCTAETGSTEMFEFLFKKKRCTKGGPPAPTCKPTPECTTPPMLYTARRPCTTPTCPTTCSTPCPTPCRRRSDAMEAMARALVSRKNADLEEARDAEDADEEAVQTYEEQIKDWAKYLHLLRTADEEEREEEDEGKDVEEVEKEEEDEEKVAEEVEESQSKDDEEVEKEEESEGKAEEEESERKVVEELEKEEESQGKAVDVEKEEGKAVENEGDNGERKAGVDEEDEAKEKSPSDDGEAEVLGCAGGEDVEAEGDQVASVYHPLDPAGVDARFKILRAEHHLRQDMKLAKTHGGVDGGRRQHRRPDVVVEKRDSDCEECTTRRPCTRKNTNTPICLTRPPCTKCPTRAPCTTKCTTRAPCTTKCTTPCTTKCTTKKPCTTKCTTRAPCTTKCTTRAPCSTKCTTRAPCTTKCTTRAPCTTKCTTRAPCTTKCTTRCTTRAPCTTRCTTRAPCTTRCTTRAPCTTKCTTRAPCTTKCTTKKPCTTKCTTPCTTEDLCAECTTRKPCTTKCTTPKPCTTKCTTPCTTRAPCTTKCTTKAPCTTKCTTPCTTKCTTKKPCTTKCTTPCTTEDPCAECTTTPCTTTEATMLEIFTCSDDAGSASEGETRPSEGEEQLVDNLLEEFAADITSDDVKALITRKLAEHVKDGDVKLPTGSETFRRQAECIGLDYLRDRMISKVADQVACELAKRKPCYTPDYYPYHAYYPSYETYPTYDCGDLLYNPRYPCKPDDYHLKTASCGRCQIPCKKHSEAEAFSEKELLDELKDDFLGASAGDKVSLPSVMMEMISVKSGPKKRRQKREEKKRKTDGEAKREVKREDRMRPGEAKRKLRSFLRRKKKTERLGADAAKKAAILEHMLECR